MKQPDEVMRKLGFTDCVPEKWYYFKTLYKENTGSYVDAGISLNVSVNKETWETKIYVLDEAFLQPCDFENIKTPYFDKVRARHKEEMNRLRNAGVIEQIVKDAE